MLFWSIFLKMHKKLITAEKRPKIPTKRTFERLLFSKLNQSPLEFSENETLPRAENLDLDF